MDFPSSSTSYHSYSYSEYRYSETKVSIQSGAAKIPQDDDVELLGTPDRESAATYSKLSSSLPGLGGEDVETERSVAASTILSFIEAGVRSAVAEGASEDVIAEKITAGLKGFVDGFDDAYGQLSEMGFLYDDVEDVIEQTFTEVLDGVEAIADEFEVELPLVDNLRAYQDERRANFVPVEPPTPVVDTEASPEPESFAPVEQVNTLSSAIREITDDTAVSEARNLQTLIEASTFDYRSAKVRSFNFTLKTQDGDTVTIRAASASSSALEGVSANYANGESNSVAGNFKSVDGFYFDVQGEIDDGEFEAIADLLGQVKNVSDAFFEGDLEEAFEYALSVGFDSTEIAKFSLRLRSASVVSAEERYQSAAPLGQEVTKFNDFSQRVKGGDERLLMISRFIENIEAMRFQANTVGISGSFNDQQDEEKVGFAFVRSIMETLNDLAPDDSVTETEPTAEA